MLIESTLQNLLVYVVEDTVAVGRAPDAVSRGAGWSHAIRYRLARLIGMVELRS